MTLKNVNLNTSATFRCEVSADEPDFQTVMRQANLTVIRKFPLHLLLLLLLLLYLSQRGGGGEGSNAQTSSSFILWLHSKVMKTTKFHYHVRHFIAAMTMLALDRLTLITARPCGLCVSVCVYEVCAPPLSGEGGGRVHIHYTFFFFFLQKRKEEGRGSKFLFKSVV